MTLLTQDQLSGLALKVEEAEKKTDAEIVCVLAGAADDYYYISTLWAALTAMLILPIMVWFTPFWLESSEIMVVQWLSFIMLALLFRLPRLKMLLVPGAVKKRRAAHLARRQFLEQNLHTTKSQLGALVFVAEAEHYVEILVDQGISVTIENDQWQPVIKQLVSNIKAGEVEKGFHGCIDSVATLLGTVFPPTNETGNELPDRLVVL